MRLLWLLVGLPRSPISKSAELWEDWEIYDNRLQFVPVADALAIGDALTDRDVHLAWRIRSTAAESALASAFGLAGGPVPSQGLCSAPG